MEQASTFIKKFSVIPKKAKSLKHYAMQIPFVMGCDLNSRPDDAAFDMLIGKDIFDKSTPWILPKTENKDSMEFYGAVEQLFHKKLNAGKLDPVIYNLDSVYETCTYHGGMHTSRAPTCYSH